jgi:IstB-like ATP binding protein
MRTRSDTNTASTTAQPKSRAAKSATASHGASQGDLLDDALRAQLTALNLPFMREHCHAMAHTAADKHWSHLDYLTELAASEAAAREDRRVQRRIKDARFPLLKTLDQFDWNWPTKINRMQVQNLLRLDFVAQHGNAVFISATGLGKTHLMTALGHAACLRGYSVLFTGAIDIINALAAAQAGGSIKRALDHYVHRRARLPTHRQVRRRRPIPDPQPSLRTGLDTADDEQGLQAMGRHLQQRQRADLGAAGPAAAPRRDRHHRGAQLPDQGSDRCLTKCRRSRA